MVTWAEFDQAAGELADLARERFEGAGLVLLGSMRKDGWPRISPVECQIFEGQLYLGMMWRSRKALDLLRDPRCVVHSLVTDKEGTEGDVKVYGRALDVTDPDERERYGQVLQEQIGWRPEGDFHLFALDIDQVGYVRFEGGEQITWRWRRGEALAPPERRRPPA
jgi:hypothetical protein